MRDELRAKGFSYEKIREAVLATGLLAEKKSRTYKKKHELFVPKEWLDKAEEMNGVRGYTKCHDGSEHLALVDDWLKCSCGCNIIYDPKTKNIKCDGSIKTYHYYRCTNGKGAHNKFDNIHGEKIWEQFSDLLNHIIISEE